MPRLPRLVLPGYLHHITQRGNNRKVVFLDDQDRITYLKYFNKYCQQYGVLIYAFCLMDNHVHFILKPLERDALARALNVAHQRYSFYFNKRNRRCGHLWQERFFSCPLHHHHIERAIKYVEMNPVRAGMVQYAWHHAWSSAKAHMGKKYQIIKLADIKEYVPVGSWKNFLMTGEHPEDIKHMRECTKYGKMAGPVELVRKLEEKLNVKLLRNSHGRPRGKR